MEDEREEAARLPEKPGGTPGAGRGRLDNLVQFIKFGLVGVMNTGVDFLVFALLTWLGMQYLLAQVFSYSAGTLNSYMVNKLWTFGGGRGAPGKAATPPGSPGTPGAARSDKGEFVRFAVVNVFTLLLSIVLLYTLKTGLQVDPLIAKIGVTAVTVVVNYIGSKLWVFRGK